MKFGKATAQLRNPNTRAGSILYGGVSGAAALALAASGCGSTEQTLTDPTTAPALSKPDQDPQLVFDDLGGGSAYIRVYPGPNADPDSDNGTYLSGQSVGAICDTKGRPVQSDPSVGEEPRQSDEWIKIDGTPGETQFATAVYARNPDQLVLQLPECP